MYVFTLVPIYHSLSSLWVVLLLSLCRVDVTSRCVSSRHLILERRVRKTGVTEGGGAGSGPAYCTGNATWNLKTSRIFSISWRTAASMAACLSYLKNLISKQVKRLNPAVAFAAQKVIAKASCDSMKPVYQNSFLTVDKVNSQSFAGGELCLSRYQISCI